LLVVIFDRPANPGNLGTILRSCDALGADGLIITGHGVDLYDPETVSASVGSLFAVPAVRVASPRELEPWFALVREQIGPFQLVGSSARANQLIFEYDWRPPTLLVIGNETNGLSAYYKERCDAIVTIAQVGAATSLNVASAASILLYEIQRQRTAN
jgi:tRNA G18 (ribose-2'-O)-methylase SpoU